MNELICLLLMVIRACCLYDAAPAGCWLHCSCSCVMLQLLLLLPPRTAVAHSPPPLLAWRWLVLLLVLLLLLPGMAARCAQGRQRTVRAKTRESTWPEAVWKAPW